MKFLPLHDRLVIKRVEAFGGIIIPDTAKEKPRQMGAWASKAMF